MTRKDTLVDLLIHDLTGPLSIVSTSVNNLLTREEKYGPYNNNHKETLKRSSATQTGRERYFRRSLRYIVLKRDFSEKISF